MNRRGMRLILASASPRRKDLLAQLGLSPEIIPLDLDESLSAGETPEHYVQRLARAKAAQCLAELQSNEDTLVLGADTAVVVDGQVLGKPVDRAEALSMLALIEGRSHRVLSAVAVCNNRSENCELSETVVTMRPIDELERRWYWSTGEPRGKAGAYAIQGLGGRFVSNIRGSYSGVVGLPLFETANLLVAHGMELQAVADQTGSE